MNIIRTRIGDAMTLNFGTSGSRIECACYGYHSYIWISSPVGEATGLGFCSGKYPVQHEGYQWEQLTGDLKIELKFASKAHSESDPILGLSKGLHDCNVLTIGGANQADVFMLLS